MHDIWPQLRNWVEAHESFALATVVKARNPSPRGIGATLAISANGQRFIGSVSAGCVEAEVIKTAQDCLRDGQTRWTEYGPSQGFPWEVALSCGGRITVRIEPFVHDSIVTSRLVQLLNSNVVGLWIKSDRRQALLVDDEIFTQDEAAWSPETLELAKAHLRNASPTQERDTADGRVLFRSITKPHRLFIVGAVHIATHLVTIARSLDYQSIVIDPREAYARPERFATSPDKLIHAWPAEALAPFELGENDGAALLTHDPKIDDQALEVLLQSDCRYLGALGSRRSHQARLKRLANAGFRQKDLDRIHGPIGLDIGSRTPAEIAISIMAQVIQTKNAGAAESRPKVPAESR